MACRFRGSKTLAPAAKCGPSLIPIVSLEPSPGSMCRRTVSRTGRFGEEQTRLAIDWNRVARAVSLTSATFLVFLLGLAAGRYDWMPSKILEVAETGSRALTATGELPWYYKALDPPYPAPITHRAGAQAGLNLVTRLGRDAALAAEILDMDGQVLQRWDVDWFTVWPDATHLPPHVVPRRRMETHVHGAVVMSNGDLVFNYEHLGLVRLNRESEVVWRLPYQTHHSVTMDERGHLWVCGQRERSEPDAALPLRVPVYDEYTIVEVSPEGRILEEWVLSDLLRQNGREGLYYMGPPLAHLLVRDDLLHLNDVEPFPSTMAEGFFKHGDVMVSLRNVNTVLVFNRETGMITYVAEGMFIRQHDADFIDGQRFSVFDNNPRSHLHPLAALDGSPPDPADRSRIVIVTAPGQEQQEYLAGGPSFPFYSPIMGKHQWLANGNLLVTESTGGRAFEVNARGEMVWEYYNFIDEGTVAVVEEVQRLPLRYASLFGGDETAQAAAGTGSGRE